MTEITTPNHPSTYGFETGVRPPEWTYNVDPARFTVIDRSTLPGALGTGTASPRALRIHTAPYEGSGYLAFTFLLDTAGSIKFKMASTANTAVTIWLDSNVAASVDDATGWHTIDLPSDVLGAHTIEIDFGQVSSPVAATQYLTDIEVTNGYINIGSITGDDGGLGVEPGDDGWTPTPVGTGDYLRGQIAKHNGFLWLCLAESTDEEPGTGADWANLAADPTFVAGPTNTLRGPGLWLETAAGVPKTFWFDDGIA